MDDVAGEVDAVLACFEDVALQVYLDEVGRGDLVIAETVFVDEELVFGAWYATGDVVVEQIGHVEVIGQSVGGGELHPGFPFFV